MKSGKGKKSKIRKTLTMAQDPVELINSTDLSAFLDQSTELDLLRWTNYFRQVLSAVSDSKFEWLKVFSDSPLNTIVDVPICHISEDVYRISTGWINRHSDEGLKSFVIFLFKSIMAGVEKENKLSGDDSYEDELHIVKKANYRDSQSTPNTSLESQAQLLTLSIILRIRPHVLISSLPLLRDYSKIRSHDKLLMFSWMIAQAAEGDITVGLYSWTRNMLPVLGSRSNLSPRSWDVVLQVAERIISVPNARNILCEGATINGERLISTSSLELLMRLSCSSDSAHVKETKRFQAIYPTLAVVALSFKSTEVTQASQHFLPLLLKLAGADAPVLSQEAARLSIWCLTKTPDCFKHWREIYMKNLKGSVVVLITLRHRWKRFSPKFSDHRTIGFTINRFMQQNDEARAGGVDAATLALIRLSNKHSLELLKMVTWDIFWPLGKKVITIVSVAFIVFAIFYLSFVLTDLLGESNQIVN